MKAESEIQLKKTRNSTAVGRFHEQKVSITMDKLGWKILAQNYRGVGFELDILALKGETLAIVEVKYRTCRFDEGNFNDIFFTKAKKKALVRGAQDFLSKQTYSKLQISTVRFDLALVIPRRSSIKKGNKENQNALLISESNENLVYYYPGSFEVETV